MEGTKNQSYVTEIHHETMVPILLFSFGYSRAHSIYPSFISNIPDFPLSHIHIVSSYSGQNVKMAIKEIDDFRAQRDIYIVGCVNSGKSSFINSALLHVGIGGVKVTYLVLSSSFAKKN